MSRALPDPSASVVEPPADPGEAYFDPEEFTTRDEVEERHYWHVHRRAVVRSVIAGLFGPDHHLLEIGCGVGTVATHLNQHGFQVDYADVHQLALRYAQARTQRLLPAPDQRRFFGLDISTDVPPAGYDGYLLLDVLEHLPDDLQALVNIRQALGTKENGRLVLTVPAFQHLWTSWDDLQRHKRRYRAGELRLLAERAGLRVVRASYFFTPLYLALLADKLLQAVVARALPIEPVEKNLGDHPHGRNHVVYDAIIPGALAPERIWLRRWSLPVGTSLLCVLRAA